MRDFLPADVRRREYVIGVIKDVYERYGFEPLETPAVENIETLMGKYGEEGNQLIFKILKRGEHGRAERGTVGTIADLALRYDLTVPLARVVAEYRDSKLPRVFKRYQIQPVWRADRPARGRFREFYQCDLDIIDSTSLAVEAELCSAVSEVLQRLGFNDFVIRVNHRSLLNDMLAAAGIGGKEQSAALVVIDKLDKIGVAGVEVELARQGIVGEGLSTLLQLLATSGQSFLDPTYGISILGRLARYLEERGLPGERWRQDLPLLQHLVERTAASRRIRFDPSLAGGLYYYTGIIMEIAVPDLVGSLGGGGRYDNLIGMFLGSEVPACGFSLGLERIILIMTERNMFPTSLVTAPAEIMVAVSDPNFLADALGLAAELRSEGKRVDVYPEPAKLKKQLRCAQMRGIPEVAIVGSEEHEAEIVSVKDMNTGEQRHERRMSWKRKIFEEFIVRARLRINPDSITGMYFPGLDFTCSIEGNRHYFKLTEIVDEELAKNYHISLKTMQSRGGAFSQEPPLKKVFRTRAAKPPNVADGSVELIAYYDKQYPPLDQPDLIQRTEGNLAEERAFSGQWTGLG